MKTIKILILSGAVLFCFSTQAQLKLGAKFGVNLNNLVYDYKVVEDEPLVDMKFGFHLGLVAEKEFTDKLSLQSGLIYSKKGANYNVEHGLFVSQSVEGKSSVSLHYIDIPVHFTLKIDELQIYAGPYLGWNFGGKIKNDYTVTTEVWITFIDVYNEEYNVQPIYGKLGMGELDQNEVAISAFDYGVDFGIGLLVSDAILLNGGYSLGLSNMNPQVYNDDIDSDDEQQYNRVISISASYFFGQ